jgi:hypothetical protein
MPGQAYCEGGASDIPLAEAVAGSSPSPLITSSGLASGLRQQSRRPAAAASSRSSDRSIAPHDGLEVELMVIREEHPRTRGHGAGACTASPSESQNASSTTGSNWLPRPSRIMSRACSRESAGR